MRTTREDLDGELQRQMCLSVPRCTALAFTRLAVSTCKSFDTHHTHEPALREECTLSRVAILAHTRLRQVVLRSGSACLNNRMSSCCDENEEQCNRSLSTNGCSLHGGKLYRRGTSRGLESFCTTPFFFKLHTARPARCPPGTNCLRSWLFLHAYSKIPAAHHH